MPKSKKEKVAFSLLMSAFMVYGMEVYNHLLLGGGLRPAQFMLPPLEFALLMLTVIVLETWIGGPLARRIACSLPGERRGLALVITIQICTVGLMCPMMSLAASVVFKQGLQNGLLQTWLDTVAQNLPMALAWQLLAAGPLVRFLVLKLPARRCAAEAVRRKE